MGYDHLRYYYERLNHKRGNMKRGIEDGWSCTRPMRIRSYWIPGVLCVAGHCRCASTIRGPFPDCATSQSRENAGVGRPFALCIVRAMLSHIDSDPIQQGEMCVGVASQECLSATTTLTLRRSTAARAYVHSDRQGAGASAGALAVG